MGLGGWQSCSSPQIYQDLRERHYTFLVRGIDDLGNAGPVAQRAFTVHRYHAEDDGVLTLLLPPAGRQLKLKHRKVKLPIACPAGEQDGDCEGKLKIRSRQRLRIRRHGRVKRTKPVLAHNTYRTAPGRDEKVKFKLARKVWKAIGTRKKLRVELTARVGDGTGYFVKLKRRYELEQGPSTAARPRPRPPSPRPPSPLAAVRHGRVHCDGWCGEGGTKTMTMQTETEDPRRRAIGGRWASAPRLVLLAATAAAFTLLGLAPSSATAHRVRDRARDTVDHGGRPARDYDIRAAKSDRHGRHKLKHVVRVRGHALIGDAAVPGSGVSVEIDARKGSPGDCGGLTRDPRHRAEYVVSAELGGVVDCRHPLAPRAGGGSRAGRTRSCSSSART